MSEEEGNVETGECDAFSIYFLRWFLCGEKFFSLGIYIDALKFYSICIFTLFHLNFHVFYLNSRMLNWDKNIQKNIFSKRLSDIPL